MRVYLDYRSLLLEWKEQYAPKTWTEEWNEKFMTSLSELTVVEYYLDILLFGDRADKEVLVKEKWTMMAGLIFIISLNGITSSQVKNVWIRHSA
mgnify:FL=1